MGLFIDSPLRHIRWGHLRFGSRRRLKILARRTGRSGSIGTAHHPPLRALASPRGSHLHGEAGTVPETPGKPDAPPTPFLRPRWLEPGPAEPPPPPATRRQRRPGPPSRSAWSGTCPGTGPPRG